MINNKIQLNLAAAFTLAANTLLAQESYDLGEITVSSASKSEQSIKDVTSNVEVITGAELEEKHVKTVSEALNTLSGISVTSNGGLGQLDSLFIRGIDSKRILILIDGIRYNEPTGLSGAPLAQLMIDDIEQIEVVKGAQSGIWGADASGGVVNIITKRAKKGTHGSILFEAGSFKTRKYIATVSHRSDDYFIKLNGSRLTTDGFSAFEAKKDDADYGKRGDELGLERDGYKNTTYSIQGGVNLSENDKVDALYKNIHATYDYDSSTGDNLTNQAKINHTFKSANYYHKTERTDTKLTASQSRFDREQGTFNTLSYVNEFAVQSKFNYNLEDMILIGANKQNFEDKKNEVKYNTTALFTSNLNKFDNLILSETLRYDDNSKFDEKVTGKIGIKYNFNQDTFISSNFGTAYNAPTLGNLSYTPTLKPETTKSFDLSLGYKSLKVTYFENRITDMINYSFVPSFHYINEEGESRLKGVEIDYKKEILPDTLFSLNYTRLSAKNKDGEVLARRAKDTVKFGVDYYGFDKLHLGLNGEYVGKRYDDADEQGAQTGKYTVANFVANYDLTRDIKIYGKIDNITDKYYQSVDGYATSERAYYAGVKVSF